MVWCIKGNNSIERAISEHRGQNHAGFDKPLEQLAKAVHKKERSNHFRNIESAKIMY